MALVRNITQRFDIPHEPGEFAILRKLTWKQLERARELRADAGMQKMKAAGGELLESIAKLRKQAETDAKQQEQRVVRGLQLLDGKTGEPVGEEQAPANVAKTAPALDVLAAYDLETVLRFGVANLSYVQEFKEDVVLELDTKTAQVLGRAILTLSEVGVDEAAAEKNG